MNARLRNEIIRHIWMVRMSFSCGIGREAHRQKIAENIWYLRSLSDVALVEVLKYSMGEINHQAKVFGKLAVESGV